MALEALDVASSRRLARLVYTYAMHFATLLTLAGWIAAEDACERYPLIREGPFCKRPWGNVAVLSGDALIEDDLVLDREHPGWQREGKELAGLMIEGDLEVLGNVVNRVPEYGAYLWVGGSLQAQHALFGGSYVKIAGDGRFAGVLVGHYNDGSVEIDGTTEAKLVINDDHRMVLDSTSPAWEDDTSLFGPPLSAYLHPTIPVAFDEDDEDQEALLGLPKPGTEPSDGGDDGEDDYVDTLGHIFEHIKTGQPVLREDLPEITRESWIHAVGHKPALVRRLPADLRTAEFYADMVRQQPHTVAALPESLRTDDLYRIAVEHRGELLSLVPEDLLTADHYELALRSAPIEDLFSDLPDGFKRDHPEIVDQALAERPWLIEELPADLRSQSRILTAVGRIAEHGVDASRLFRSLKGEQLSDEVIEAIAVSSSLALLMAPPERVTADMLARVHEHFGSVARPILQRLPEQVVARYREFVRQAAETKTARWPSVGVRFEYSSQWTLEEFETDTDRIQWYFDAGTFVVALVGVPPGDTPDMEDMLRTIQEGEEPIKPDEVTTREHELDGLRGHRVDSVIDLGKRLGTEGPVLRRRAVLLRKPVGSASVVIHATYDVDEEPNVAPDLIRLLRSIQSSQ